MIASVSGEAPTTNGHPEGFRVRLTNFEGPFDLLLQLIFAHRLDVTEVALHQVTDDFIAYTREIGSRLELEETTAFLVIAATLLDLGPVVVCAPSHGQSDARIECGGARRVVATE